MLAEIQALSRTFLINKFEKYHRSFIKTHPIQRFMIILGERGVGKTTTLIQYLMAAVQEQIYRPEILYMQADHFLMNGISLYELVDDFQKQGGKIVAVDEIHKYPEWSMELKSIYDTFPQLTILASGSSALEVAKGSHDLSRRALVYRMTGLSFREYLEIKYGLVLPHFSLAELLKNHEQIAIDLAQQLSSQDLNVLKLLGDYLEAGYYPYFREFTTNEPYWLIIEQNLHTTIESDLLAIYEHLTGNSIRKIKQLLLYIAKAVPFTPNWQKIKAITEIGDDRTIKTYFKYLEDASIITTLNADSHKIKRIELPEKIYLSNPNQLYAYASRSPNLGTVRETFFAAMLKDNYDLTLSKAADFVVNHQYHFEIGGKSKDTKQIQGLPNSYLALADILHGSQQRIPLWLFGFVY